MPRLENVYLAVARFGPHVKIYSFAYNMNSSLTPKERFEQIVRDQGWEEFDSVEIHSIPTAQRDELHTILTL